MPLFGRSKDDRATSSDSPRMSRPDPVKRSVADQRDFLLSQVSGLRAFGMGLLDAWGLALCESLDSDIDLPTFTAATAAGWAVRGSNLVGASPLHPITLPVVDRIDAGGFRGAPLTPGTAVRVEAGSPLPEGADAVVALAEGTEDDELVTFAAEVTFHQNLRLVGSRIADGDPLLASGTVLDARSIGLLAEVGLDKVLARPRPRVVVMTLDADLVAPGLPLTRLVQGYDATTPLVAAAARADGAQVFPIGIVAREAKALRRALTDQLLRADLLVIVGSIDDAVADLLDELGTLDICEVAMEPAASVASSTVGEEKVPVLVLPPGGVATYIAYQAFCRPVVLKLAGLDPDRRRAEPRPTTVPLPSAGDRTQFLLASIADRGVTPLTLPSDAGAVELARANSIVVIPAGGGDVPAHADVTCWLLDEQPR